MRSLFFGVISRCSCKLLTQNLYLHLSLVQNTSTLGSHVECSHVNLVEIFILVKYLHRSSKLFMYLIHKDSWRARKRAWSLSLNVKKKI